MPIAARPASIAQRLFPVFRWLPAYRREWLLPDALAGLAVWAVMVPESMAYAGIVGVPPIMGDSTVSATATIYWQNRAWRTRRKPSRSDLIPT